MITVSTEKLEQYRESYKNLILVKRGRINFIDNAFHASYGDKLIVDLEGIGAITESEAYLLRAEPRHLNILEFDGRADQAFNLRNFDLLQNHPEWFKPVRTSNGYAGHIWTQKTIDDRRKIVSDFINLVKQIQQ